MSIRIMVFINDSDTATIDKLTKMHILNTKQTQTNSLRFLIDTTDKKAKVCIMSDKVEIPDIFIEAMPV